MIKNENKQLVYAINKPGRGVKFFIYTNGKVILEGKGSQYGLNVPAKLREWITPQKTEKERSYKLTLTLEIGNGIEKCILKDHLSKLVIKQNKWYLKPEDISCLGSNLYELLTNRANVKCVFTLPKKLWSKQFIQAIQIINSYSHNEKSDFSVIVFGGKGTGSYEVLQDSKGQILVKFSGSIKDGAIQLPAELEKIFQEWATTREQLLYICENELPIIGYTTLINSKSRHERVRKVLHIPYNGLRKQVDLILYSPNLKLTEQIQLDLEIKEQLVKAGCNISSLISNVKPGSDHRDRTLEHKYQQFLTKVFDKHKGTYAQTEVRISTSKNQKNIPIKNSYTFDFMVFQPAKYNDNQPLTLLCEFKTSLGKGKAVIITEAIADLRHIHHQIGKDKTVPILFLCEDLKTGKDVLTRTYSNYCGVLLIGPKDFAVFEENPSLFLKRLLQFQQIQNTLRNQSTHVLHPQTQRIVSRKDLEEETENMLDFSDNLICLNFDAWKKQYCTLMGIRMYDFQILFRFFQEEYVCKNSKSFFTASKRTIQTRNTALKKIHHLLRKHKSVAIIEGLNRVKKNNYFQKILKHRDVILSTFPSDVIILGQKFTNDKGIAFEQKVSKTLEKDLYSTATNLWCYYHGRKFEVDIIGFKEDKIILASCKDMSTYNNWDQLVVDIKVVANKLKYRKELTNASYAKVFINANSKYKAKLQQKFSFKTWSKNVDIEISP